MTSERNARSIFAFTGIRPPAHGLLLNRMTTPISLPTSGEFKSASIAWRATLRRRTDRTVATSPSTTIFRYDNNRMNSSTAFPLNEESISCRLIGPSHL